GGAAGATGALGARARARKQQEKPEQCALHGSASTTEAHHVAPGCLGRAIGGRRAVLRAVRLRTAHEAEVARALVVGRAVGAEREPAAIPGDPVRGRGHAARAPGATGAARAPRAARAAARVVTPRR